ncbi:MAG TPA: HlyD family efflux transporter periplasmic adaptor subunit [Bacteroidota bacterium]|jgi:HlyD family secretion protein|nr:HlyD family efflux transporter periplasmic adaptor subunit [Bacteroidota bacterium]
MESQDKKIIQENLTNDLSQSGMDRKIEKKVWTTRRIVYAGGGALLLFMLVYNFVFGDRSSRLNVEMDKLTISTVVKGPFQEYTPVSGTILPIETFYLDAIEGGRVEKRYVDAGTFVKKGDPIIRLANSNLQLDVMYREALSYEQINNAQNRRLAIEQNTISVRTQLSDVEYQVDRTQLLFRRDSVLAAKNLIADQEFKQTREEYAYWLGRRELARLNFRQDSLLRSTQLVQLESSIKRLQENLEMTKLNLENLILKAPISGELTSLNAEIGESKSPGQRLGQIDVLDNFKVRASIDEFYIARIKPGQTGEFELTGATNTLKITKVYPEVQNGRFDVDLQFVGKPPEGIRRGQTLQIRLELGDLSEALLVARGGFYQKTGGQWVFVVDESGSVAVKRQVKLGRQNPQAFEILEGLEPGEQVITSSYDNFGDNDKLILKK